MRGMKRPASLEASSVVSVDRKGVLVAYIGLLVAVPLVTGIALLFAKSDEVRAPIVWGGAVATAVLSVASVLSFLGTPWVLIDFRSAWFDMLATLAGLAASGTVVYFGIKWKKPFAVALAAVQIACTLAFEFLFAHGIEVRQGLYVDSLSLVMALIIGTIGSGICVYALGYMKDFQHHHGSDDDRRHHFFALMFVFLSAMFVIVFSNNLAWVFSGWEITTVCSFLLIGYTRTPEAIDNSFRQIMMNMAGGIALAVGLMLVAFDFHTLSMADFVALGVEYPQIAAVPACAFAFAGLTKAAQMPFHTWLLGAMVAPTPTSALLHSSTMVKAGVFLLVKLAPIFFVCAAPSLMVIGVGGLTFLVCSFMAISQSNAKRVLAYSTVANLGLIVACAGVGTAEAVWAAILLIVFHAAAKSLLFLCVGTAEHHIGSRDIEDMDLLFERMPNLARYMMIGIMCMFIAPFGMLIAKWAALVSFADTHQFALIMFLAFGSGATFLFWAKWLGKLSGIAADQDNVELDVHTSEWVALNVMAAAALVSTILLPVFSFAFVEPYIVGVFGTLGQNIATDNLWVASILAAFALAAFFARVKRTAQQKGAVYLSGVAVDGDARTFRDSLTREATASTRNMYLEEYFGEARWRPIGEAACTAVIVCCFLYGFVQFGLFA